MSSKRKLPKKLLADRNIERLLLLIVGLLVGGVAGSWYQANQYDHGDSSMHRSATTNSTETQKDNIDRRYESAKRAVKHDLNRKRIDQAKSTLLLAKLKEVYQYRLDHLSSTDTSDLMKKHTEWKEWARQNDVSSKYLVYLY